MLRQRLHQQLEKDVFQEQGPPEELDRGGRRRDRDRRDRDGNYGWWDHERDEDVVGRRNGRLIIDLGRGNLFVQPIIPDEGGRLLYGADDVTVEEMRNGWTRTTVHRANGVDIVTVRNRYGDIVRRTKVLPDGRRIVLIDNRGDYYSEDYDDPLPPAPILYDVPPPIIGIPRNRYIVDYGQASEDDISYALRAPPVQAIQRPYTLNEVLQNQTVRDYSPRIDLDSITFEFGSAVIGTDQMNSLGGLGEAMEQVISENPDEVYLIEGHTDAVGSPEDNLILSDERAEAVATALSQNFDIPPENLVTKGYGEEFLKVSTSGPERQNRRATVRRLTELLQAQNE
jgi:outer membrane protein OmpA-like peptidoglycan-associated protein